VVGFGYKNGGFYVLDAATGKVLHNTPVYRAPVAKPERWTRERSLCPAPSGIADRLRARTARRSTPTASTCWDSAPPLTARSRVQPTGGRVVSISLDTTRENWRHERPKIKAIGGTKEKPAFTDVGDPVASGIALANGVAYFTTAASNKLVALDTSDGTMLKEIDLGPVWCGPTVSRGRVYVGTGNLLFNPADAREAYFPKSFTGAVYSFGLPGDDDITRMGGGDE
jgi:outer membrane protein assembly factor BamB